MRNRSVPAATVIPELAYADVVEASDWLCNAFGFEVRLRIGDHRAQLVFGDGAVIVIELGERSGTSSVLVRVEDADAHHERAARAGARILDPPTDYPYGERQYNAEDLGGHRWTFSQSIADVDPASWGATDYEPRELVVGEADLPVDPSPPVI
ncbi:MAG: VOC family protein [Actinomycetota bacterium]|nr:VOC family protein [Actinomycetota bacterium]